MITSFNIPLLALSWAFLLPLSHMVWGQHEVRIGGKEVPVYQEEVELFKVSCRAEAIRHFTQHHHLPYKKGFWEQEVDGQTPQDYLTMLSLKALLPFKIQQAWMIKHGLLDRWDWGSFNAQYQAYNRQRQIAQADSKVLYGPVSLSLKDYYVHYFTHHQAVLIRQMVKTGTLKEDSIEAYDTLIQEELAQAELSYHQTN